ncbi:MAG: acyltransferase family protein, partial [Hymenobacteraceae bacterium]|nr:acyltransferase family protein [Hymenobacteraceae bacterium]
MPSSSAVAPRQSALDMLRWWAFVAIFLAHAGPTLTTLAPATFEKLATLNFALLAVGNVAAQVFFTLSGYWVIGQLAAEKTRTGRVAVGRFWGRRAGRL